MFKSEHFISARRITTDVNLMTYRARSLAADLRKQPLTKNQFWRQDKRGTDFEGSAIDRNVELSAE